ncbi:MAG: hypothetical protein K2I12_06360 [Duncaniella sp.]|nr:hypothetical protein [Duncaniella sp.]MDE6765735.1 hypothetical protein [Duncaniella sp.]
MPRYLKVIFSAMLMTYLVISLFVSAAEPDDGLCTGMTVEVTGNADSNGFVTSDELIRELDSLPSRAAGMNLANICTDDLRRRLLALDKIEDASVVRYTDGSIRIKAVPIEPVLRVFDSEGSYYVNRAGKRVTASARYHKNVPIIEGDFNPSDSIFTPLSLMPLVQYIASDSVWSNFVSMIKVKSPRDIILIPVVRDHVINIGAPVDLENKFYRLSRFYTEVLPRQGWEKYDTLTVKWNGQLVATKRHRRQIHVEVSRYEEDESVDTGTMLAGDDVAPGRAVPGVKAHSETPIPARRKAEALARASAAQKKQQ